LEQGQVAQLSEFGKWRKTKGLSKIKHEDLERIINIEVSFHEEKIKKAIFSEKVDEALKSIREIYPSLQFDVRDADREEEKNKKALSKMMIICLAMILFVLAVVLNSIIQPLLIGMAIPFGVIGVIWAFYFHGTTVNVMAIIGVLGMAGVVVNDSLIMVDLINRLKAKNPNFARKDLIDGAASRLRAILLTSITTLGGVFPMAYGLGGDSGFTKPLALAMGWGLLFATGLTLLVVPAMLEIHRDVLGFFAKYKGINRVANVLKVGSYKAKTARAKNTPVVPVKNEKGPDEPSAHQ
jgi:multidrug efflux pump subunit AcrB